MSHLLSADRILSRPVLLRIAAYTLGLVVLTGCDKIKEMITKSADAGADADSLVDAAAVADAGAADDASVPDASAAPIPGDDMPTPDAEDSKANRDIGFGNYKDELGKLEKEADTASKKK